MPRGVKTILCSQEEIYDQSKFEQVFSHVSRALFFATPTKLKNYILQSKTKEFLRHIGTFVVGGEVFPDDLYKLLMEHTRSQTCYNGYGPAEASIGVTYHKLLPPRIFNIYGPAETTIWVTEDNLNGRSLQ